MAEFNMAFEKTMGHEGAYSNDPEDVGGETFMGISRRYNPSWKGWKVIDNMKDRNINISLKSSPTLLLMVRDLYKQMYWDRFMGDFISSQFIAEELFDTSVNMGVSEAVSFLQRGLNCLNRNESLFNDLVEDGKMGPITLSLLESLDEEELLFKIMNVLQGAHYIEYMRKSPLQEKYCRGWFKRVIVSKEK